MEQTAAPRKREIWLDWMRVAACLMVVVVHSAEPFYLGGDGSLVLTAAEGFWADFFDSLVRCCVPLFVVASAWLQFPLHYSTGEFFRRRAVRILVPFAVWTLVYALVWGEPVQNLKDLLLNFNYAAGHLWFVYMLVGLYLLMPLLSPWAEKVSRRELQGYLGLWLLTTLIPYLRDALGGPLTFTYGPSGLPRQALYPLWGEASWNAYGVFYYFSGFIGYLLLGLYLRRFLGELSLRKTLAIAVPAYLLGFSLTFGGFLRRLAQSAGTTVKALQDGAFPVSGPVDMAVWWETTWCNDTLGVVLMTLACILLFRKIKSEGGFYQKVVLPLSRAGYGMYLCHLLILVPLSGAVRGSLGIGEDGQLGLWTAAVEILLSALGAFILTACVSVLMQRIPKIGKYLMG